MTDAGVPEAWPAWLSREQLRAYLGGIGDATLRMVCPVAPLDLGNSVVRYRKADVDAWEATLPRRLPRPAVDEQDVVVIAASANDGPVAAIERARARAAGASAWRKSATSNG